MSQENKPNESIVMKIIRPESLAFIKDRERRAFKAGQDSVCGRCGELDCYHNKNPHSFEEYEKSEEYQK